MINKNVLDYSIKMQKVAHEKLSNIKEKTAATRIEIQRLSVCISEFERYLEDNYKEEK